MRLHFLGALALVAILVFGSPARAASLLQDALPQHSTPMLLIDPTNGKIVDVNDAAIAFYGYPRDVFVSKNIKDINSLTADQVQSEMALAKAEGRDFFIFRHRLADGTLAYVHVHSVPVALDGKTYLFSTIQPQSDSWATGREHYNQQVEQQVLLQKKELMRQYEIRTWAMGMALLAAVAIALNFFFMHRRTSQARHALQDANRHLEEIIWGTNVGTWEWNVKTGDTQFNERWAEIVGYSLADLSPTGIGTWLSLVHPDDQKRSQEALDAHFSGAAPYYECEVRMRHRDGHWVWVLDRGKVVEWDLQGKPVRVSGTHADISARKRIEGLEADLKAKLKHEVQAKDRVFSIISHDLRSPFNTILGYSRAAMQMSDHFSKEKLVEFLQNINKASEQYFEFLDGLLVWSRTQLEGFKIEPETLSVHAVTDEAIKNLTPMAESKNITVTMDLGEDTVFADSATLRTVLRNLIGNAIKFTPSGGTIRIYSNPSEHGLDISVEDTGTGISFDHPEDVFEISKKTSTAGTEGEIGTGLGLPLCKDLVAKNNGRIWIERTGKSGTTISFTVPAQKA